MLTLVAGFLTSAMFLVQEPAATGVIVEEVIKEGAAAKAGIQAGDEVLTWFRAVTLPANPESARGEINSPFDLIHVEIEQSPRGNVMLGGMRNGTAFSATLPAGDWMIKTRPRLPVEIEQLYDEARQRIEKKEVDEGIGRFRAAAATANNRNDSRLAGWLFSRVGDTLAEARRWPESRQSYERAIEEAAKAGDRSALAAMTVALGRMFQSANQVADAENAYRQALAIRESDSPESMIVAAGLDNLGLLARIRGDLAAAKNFFEKALTIKEKLAPGSLSMAATLSNLGVVAGGSGDLSAADDFFQRTLAIREKLAPGSSVLAATLNNFGILEHMRGNLARAEDLYRRTLAITEKLTPESLEVAATLNNLGIVAWRLGDSPGAEDFYRRALAIREKRAPGSLDAAGTLNNLGNLFHDRGDLAAAEDFHKRALAAKLKIAASESITVSQSLINLGNVALDRSDFAAAGDLYRKALAISEKLAPAGLDVALGLGNLGNVARARGDLTEAEDLYKRSLAVRQKLAPESIEMAEPLGNLGNVALKRGDLNGAEDFYRKALAITEKLAPGSLTQAETVRNLGAAALAREDVQTAEELFKKALAISEKLAPASLLVAGTLYDLGIVSRRKGDSSAAGDFFRRAVEALESQRAMLGGSDEVRSGFAAKHIEYYRELINQLVELKQFDAAFHALERSRARNLLEMLAEREIIFSADIPANLERERRLVDKEYDQMQARLGQLNSSKDSGQIEQLLGRLRELREKQDEIGAQIRKASPRLAALRYPEPLSLQRARQILDRGTLLLSYMVTRQKTFLFAVRSFSAGRDSRSESGLTVFTLPIGEEELRNKIEVFRNAIQHPAAQRALMGPGLELYELLVQPAQAWITPSDRILISPDGPLYALPFAALITERQSARAAGSRPRYWIETKPIHVVTSATLYAEVRKDRRPSPVSLMAFGDPSFTLAPLPSSRAEVEAIADLYGNRATVYLGDQATEERVKTVPSNVSYLHFATHGLLDERFPLNSALALTVPAKPGEGQDNGLLQAWEIFERMRIGADLVVLSACETALGKEMGGEGLIGLTRAFQYAGARSIAASLWSVADESTAELMKRFYSYLKAGKSKDEALRSAQMDLLRRAPVVTAATRLDTSHPFYWAAFTLIGDWQ